MHPACKHPANHAKLKFYGRNYKFNITFAARKKICIYESHLDNTPSYSIKRIHDIRMVRPPETSGDEDFIKLAADCRNPVFMGSGIL